jgi:hypothetical protein
LSHYGIPNKGNTRKDIPPSTSLFLPIQLSNSNYKSYTKTKTYLKPAPHELQNRNRSDHPANKAEQSDLVRPVKLEEAEFRQPVQTGRAVGVGGLCRPMSLVSTKIQTSVQKTVRRASPASQQTHRFRAALQHRLFENADSYVQCKITSKIQHHVFQAHRCIT